MNIMVILYIVYIIKTYPKKAGILDLGFFIILTSIIQFKLDTCNQLILMPVLLFAIGYLDHIYGLISDRLLILFFFIHLNQSMFVFSAILCFIFFSLFSFLQYLGFGDTKLITLMTLFYFPNVVFGLLCACILCLVITKKSQNIIYFGPYLTTGFLLVFYLQRFIIK